MTALAQAPESLLRLFAPFLATRAVAIGATLMAIPFVTATGCAAPRLSSSWRVDWRVSAEERYTDPAVSAVLQLPTYLEGSESWVVSPDSVIIESRGILPDGARGYETTWIVPDRQRVYHHDSIRDVASGEPLAQWNESRMRESRSTTVAAFERPGFADYCGDLATTRDDDAWRLRAVPGQSWRLEPEESELDWSLATLPLAFDRVTLQRARGLSERLTRLRPRSIDVISPASASRVTIVHRDITGVRQLPRRHPDRRLPVELFGEIDAAESRWADVETLWHVLDEAIATLTDPTGPEVELDLRGVRVRLEFVISGEHAGRVRELIARIENSSEAPDLAILEEAFHLLWSADPAAFERRYTTANESKSLNELLTMISVLSLKRPSGLPEKIDALLVNDSLWQGYADEQVAETKRWLRAIRYWVTNIR